MNATKKTEMNKSSIKMNKDERQAKTKQGPRKPGKTAAKKVMLERIQQQMQKESGGSISISINEVIRRLCESYENSVRLTDTENSELNETAAISKIPRNILVHNAIRMGTKFYKTRYSNVAKKLKKSDLRKSYEPGSAYLKIEAHVKKVMKQNDEVEDKMEKVFVSQTYIQATLHSHRGAVKAFLEANKDMLAEHHLRHGLTNRHGCAVAKLRRAKREVERLQKSEGRQAK